MVLNQTLFIMIDLLVIFDAAVRLLVCAAFKFSFFCGLSSWFVRIVCWLLPTHVSLSLCLSICDQNQFSMYASPPEEFDNVQTFRDMYGKNLTDWWRNVLQVTTTICGVRCCQRWCLFFEKEKRILGWDLLFWTNRLLLRFSSPSVLRLGADRW